MSSELFKNFMKKAVLNKQGPPGPPPRPGLQWKPQTHRWIRPQSGSQGVGDFMSGFVGNLDIEPKSTALRNAKPIESALKEQFGDFNFKSGYPDLESEGLANLAEHLGTEVNQDLVEKVAGGIADQAIELENDHHYNQLMDSASSDTPTNPKIQGIMNERLEEYISDGLADLGAYEIGQNMDLATKIHNEVMLDDGQWGKTVFEDAGIDIDNIGYDEMDNIVANAMEHHGITNVTPEDMQADASDDLGDWKSDSSHASDAMGLVDEKYDRYAEMVEQTGETDPETVTAYIMDTIDQDVDYHAQVEGLMDDEESYDDFQDAVYSYATHMGKQVIIDHQESLQG